MNYICIYNLQITIYTSAKKTTHKHTYIDIIHHPIRWAQQTEWQNDFTKQV